MEKGRSGWELCEGAGEWLAGLSLVLPNAGTVRLQSPTSAASKTGAEVTEISKVGRFEEMIGVARVIGSSAFRIESTVSLTKQS